MQSTGPDQSGAQAAESRSKFLKMIHNVPNNETSTPRQKHSLQVAEYTNIDFTPIFKQPGQSVRQSTASDDSAESTLGDHSVLEPYYSHNSSTYEDSNEPRLPTLTHEHSYSASQQSPHILGSSSNDEEVQLTPRDGVEASKTHVFRGENPDGEDTVHKKFLSPATSGTMRSEEHVTNGLDPETPQTLSSATGGEDIPDPMSSLTEGSGTPTRSSERDPLARPVVDARVDKHSRLDSNIRPKLHNHMHTPPRTPTEEDLLLLLMRRQRIRDQTHNRLVTNVHQLRVENQRLKMKGLEQAAELENAERMWSEAKRENGVQEANIESFKQKYDELKAWASEMHEQYAEVRAKGKCVTDELTMLKSYVASEEEHQKEQRARVVADLEIISQPVKELKEALTELQQTSAELQETKDSLRQAREESRQGKLQNQKHALYIEKLEVNQRSIDARFVKGQNEISTAISKMSGEIRKQDNTMLLAHMTDLAGDMHNLLERAPRKTEVSEYFSSLMNNAEETYLRLSAQIAKLGQTHAKCHSMQEMDKTVCKLKTEYAIELAKQSAQLQQDADEKLALKQDEINDMEKKYQALLQCKTEVESSLGNLQAEIDAKKVELSSEQEVSKGLQESILMLRAEVGDLTNNLKAVTETQSDLEKHKKVAEQERYSLQTTLQSLRAEVEKHKKEKETAAEKAEDLLKQIANLTDIREKYESKVIQLNNVLTDAAERDQTISGLERQIEAESASKDTLRQELVSARAAGQQVTGLLTSIKKQSMEVQRLTGDLRTSKEEEKTLQVSLSEQSTLLNELREEKTSLDAELERLSSMHEQCGDKDSEIQLLRQKIEKLEEEMAPLSTLIELLDHDEKLALSKKVILLLKDIIRRPGRYEVTTSGSKEVMSAKPRRAADRNAYRNNHEIVVQDSQGAGNVEQSQHQSDTSDLSEPDDDIENLAAETFDEFLPSSLSSIFPSGNVARSPERPGTSNHEMLLRSSDTGSYPRSSLSQVTIQVEASAPMISPMRTRGGSQIRHGTPTPQTGTDGERIVNFMTPSAYHHENHVPNSAAKRRQTSEAPESSAKRRNVTTKDNGPQQSRSCMKSTSRQIPNTDGGSTGTRMSSISASMPIQSKTKRSTNSARTTAKSAKMQAQFNSSVV